MLKILSLISALSVGIFPMAVLAMSSTNYKIDVDAINSGGELGSSANYEALDSIGDPFIGIGESANYALRGGFENSLTVGISLALDSDVKNLGSITPGTPISGTTTATVVTDAWGGYDLFISQDKNMTHTDAVTAIPSYACSISSPCLWSGTGLGFTIQSGTGVDTDKWGTSPNFKYAAMTTDPTIFHAKPGYKSGDDATVIEYRLDVPGTQKSGTYSNAVTYVAMARI